VTSSTGCYDDRPDPVFPFVVAVPPSLRSKQQGPLVWALLLHGVGLITSIPIFGDFWAKLLPEPTKWPLCGSSKEARFLVTDRLITTNDGTGVHDS